MPRKAEVQQLLAEQTIAEMIPVARMFRDPTYCRPLIGARVKKIVANWDDDQCDVLVVSLRDDGTCAIIDGSHRHKAAEIKHITELPARVFLDLTVPREAELFVRLNRDRSAPSPMDIFRGRLVALDAIAMDLRTIVQVAGFDIAIDRRGPGYIDAIAALESVYDYIGPEGVDAILGIVREAWGRERPRATHGHILRGLGAFWARYHKSPKYKRGRLVERMAIISPEMVLAGAMSYMTIKTGVAPHSAVGRVMVDKFNQGLRADQRLNEWQDHGQVGPVHRKRPTNKP